ncbi:hypothetical protein [Nocardia nova]|uniref:hypothetical protein n=1 Tax=Nocardia nova TaxID=37330 RepID=UPI001ED99056|nr:hypothetical protein [Nocardia nova]
MDYDTSLAPQWDSAQVSRLARRLGYEILWTPTSLIPLVDQVRAADVDAVIAPSTEHIDILTLNNLMSIVNVEIVLPRLSFSKWGALPPRRHG